MVDAPDSLNDVEVATEATNERDILEVAELTRVGDKYEGATGFPQAHASPWKPKPTMMSAKFLTTSRTANSGIIRSTRWHDLRGLGLTMVPRYSLEVEGGLPSWISP
ncbi:hypothetical protein FRB95_002871 [Tulasnella sp. JGI-2019a]|nr:hypothetical protein FRB93_013732 [Tulasnella sp. JGI-2019a]KAG9031298.1 hypothetical protein FRB95_002871 [Tulasnella sp. JGI-2019a]